MVTILEGESLVNDATAITCLRLAIAAIGGAVGIGDATVGFLIAAVGGVAVGLAVAALAVQVRKHIRQPVFDTAISIMCRSSPTSRRKRSTITSSTALASSPLWWAWSSATSAVIQSAQSRVSERVNWATISSCSRTPSSC